MATQQQIDETPTAIAGLSTEQVYEVQLLGGGIAGLETATSAPPADSPTANAVRQGEVWYVYNESGENTYVWARTPGDESMRLVINEEIPSA